MDVVDRARDLKSRAMDERDVENWDGALALLEQARQELEQALAGISSRPGGEDVRLIEFETSVRKALYGICGSLGGVYRRRAASAEAQPGDLEAAIRWYDAGHAIEQAFTDSYNLTQRLIARVLLRPDAVDDERVTVAGETLPAALRRTKAVIDGQTGDSGPRKDDEYAYADAALVALVLGEPGWRDALDGFTRRASRSSYARSATLEVLEALAAGVARSSAGAGPLLERAREAVRLARQ